MTLAKVTDPAMGVLGYTRIADDYYPTPPWCTEALLKHFKPNGRIWEPACGEGHISKVLETAGYTVFSSDLANRGYGTPDTDFLTQDKPIGGTVNSIITNPPYSGNLPEQFIKHALKLTEPAGGAVAMLLRNEFDSAHGRTPLFTHPAFALKLALTKRPRWIEGSTGSPRHNYAWFVWDWKSVGKDPTMRWGR